MWKIFKSFTLPQITKSYPGYFDRKIFNSLKESIIIVEPHTRKILDCNSYAEIVFGYSREEMVGKSTRILHINEDFFQKFDQLGKESLKKDGFFQVEFKMKRKNGEIFYTDHTVTYVDNENGEVDHVVSVVRDVTEKVKARETIEQARKEQKDILESITDGFIALDENWIVKYWNYAAENFFNTPKENILGKNLWNEFKEAKNLKMYREFQIVKQTRKSRSFEDYSPTFGKWFEISAYPRNNGVTVFFKDLTTDKNQRSEILNTKRKAEAMINNTQDSIWLVDTNRKIVFANQSFNERLKKIYGKTFENGQSLLLSDLEDQEKKRWESYYNQALAGKQFNVSEENNYNGESFYALISFNPIFNEHNQCTGTACFLKDITERTKYLNAIEKQNEQLHDIAWTQSHSVRGPLCRMLGLLNLLNMGNRSNIDQSEMVQHLYDAAHELDDITKQIVNKAAEKNNFI